MARSHQTVTVTPEQVGRIDRLVQQLTGMTRSGVRGLIDQGGVHLNGAPISEDFTRIAEGDVVDVKWDPHTRPKEKQQEWKDAAFKVVHEDKDLLVVDKAAHVLTVPTTEREGDSLLDRVTHYLNRGHQKHKKAFIVHRLDRGVSGLLVIAKSQAVMELLKNQFEARKPQRRYIGIVAGLLKQPAGTFESHLATAANLDQYSVEDEEDGKLAITHYRVKQLLKKMSATVVEVELETGRRNQIRVHFAEHGHPLLGDPRYEKAKAKHECWTARRIALHAASLGFEHPTTDKTMRFESHLPFEISRFIRRETEPTKR